MKAECDRHDLAKYPSRLNVVSYITATMGSGHITFILGFWSGMPYFCLVFLLFTVQLHVTNGHPQCLDFRPPFEVASPGLSFCPGYSDFGCCTRELDEQLAARHGELVSQLTRAGLEPCSDTLREILCQECSPYAAHVYDAETTRVKRPLPGLCQQRCERFYDDCRHVVTLLTSDTAVLGSLDSREDFCRQNRISDLDYCYPDLLDNDRLNGGISDEATTSEGCMCLQEFARDLRNPLVFETPPDGSGRIFVGEQRGVVYIYDLFGNRNREPFMDISNLVLSSSRRGDERGFLGMAFPPDFAESAKFYVYFSVINTGRQRTRISEFRISSSNRDLVDRDSERIVLEVDQPYANHNGGAVGVCFQNQTRLVQVINVYFGESRVPLLVRHVL